MVLSVIALHSCTDNTLYTDSPCEAIITGSTYKTALTEEPAGNRFTSLEVGNQILLNAFGSLEVNNEVLTYSGTRWSGSKELYWSDGASEAEVIALFPVYADLAYTEKNLYEDHSLRDVLYIHESYSFKEAINFQFKHLFSLLTLHLSEELQERFEGIEVSSSSVVSQILPESAEVVLDNSRSHSTSISDPSLSGDYSFIVPPAENSSIAVTVRTGGKQYTTQLQPCSYGSNEEYKYNLKTSEKMPGILTAEDWIAFSKLINSSALTEYKGKMLKDFGETVGGVTTYRLLGDIDFAGVDCAELEQIGYAKTDSYFSDIFDGRGYTLSNMQLKPYWGTTGVFGAISTNGIIKNLHVKSCNVNITKQSDSTQKGTSILVGNNKGMVTNCSVEDCQITVKEATDKKHSAYTGGLAGTSTGQIINCYVKGINIDYPKAQKIGANPAGALVGSAQGLILNCYSANNIVKNRGSYNGGICGKASNAAHIENCYVYGIDQVATKGLFAGEAENSLFIHNLSYNTTVKLIGKGDIKQLSKSLQYTNTFTDASNIPVYQLLNQWINDVAPTSYPDFTFTPWTSGGKDLPAIFIER